MITRDGKTYTARVYWRDGLQKRHSVQRSGFATRREAQAWEARQKSAHRGLTAAPDAHRMTVHDCARSWLAHLSAIGRSPATIAQYEWALERYVLPDIGGVRADDLRAVQMQRIIDRLRGSGLSNSSILAVHRCMRALCGYMGRAGIVPASPYQRMELPPDPVRPLPRMDAADVAQLISILRDCRHVLYVPLVLCVAYGLRRGEACGVRWCDLDLGAGSLRVTGALKMVKGSVYYGPTKTRTSGDVVALAPWFVDDLRELRRARLADGSLQLCDPAISGHVPASSIDPRVLVATENGSYIRPDGVRARLQRIQAAHGLPISSVHDLRKTYATLLVEAGLDIAVVSKALRHSSVRITSDQYVASTAPIKQRATATMDALIFPDRHADDPAHKNEP